MCQKRFQSLRRHLAGLSILLLGSLGVLAVALAGCDDLNPYLTPGEKLYRKHCAGCHGLDGAGNTPRWMGHAYADLLDDDWKIGGDRTALEDAIRDGVGDMPGFPDLTPKEVRLIIRHLRTLRGEIRPKPEE